MISVIAQIIICSQYHIIIMLYGDLSLRSFPQLTSNAPLVRNILVWYINIPYKNVISSSVSKVILLPSQKRYNIVDIIHFSVSHHVQYFIPLTC